MFKLYSNGQYEVKVFSNIDAKMQNSSISNNNITLSN